MKSRVTKKETNKKEERREVIKRRGNLKASTPRKSARWGEAQICGCWLKMALKIKKKKKKKEVNY